jgi:hypothetical protein
MLDIVKIPSASTECRDRSGFIGVDRRRAGLLLLLFAISASLLQLDGQSGSTSQPGFVSSLSIPVESIGGAELFEKFIEVSRGRLIHLHVEMDPLFARIEQQSFTDKEFLFVSTDLCGDWKKTDQCPGSHYVLLNKGTYVLAARRRKIQLDGYFMIDAQREMHQGVYYIMKGVRPPSK